MLIKTCFLLLPTTFLPTSSTGHHHFNPTTHARSIPYANVKHVWYLYSGNSAENNDR